MPHGDQEAQDDRLLVMLQRLLEIGSVDFRATFTEAATIIAEAFGADKVDVFVHQPTRNSLVALGTSQTPMGKRQQALGLDVLPLANGGRAARVFETGMSHVTGRAEEDPEELHDFAQTLGVRSAANLPLEINGQRRGVLQVDSATPEFFSEQAQHALRAVADWVELIMHRAELMEQRELEAELPSMDSPPHVPAYLEAGVWVPVEVAAQLIHNLELLQEWSKAHEPLSPALTLLIKIESSAIEYLLDRGALVPVEWWRQVAQRIQLLTEQLTSRQ